MNLRQPRRLVRLIALRTPAGPGAGRPGEGGRGARERGDSQDCFFLRKNLWQAMTMVSQNVQVPSVMSSGAAERRSLHVTPSDLQTSAKRRNCADAAMEVAMEKAAALANRQRSPGCSLPGPTL